MKKWMFPLLIIIPGFLKAQNVGIGTSSPYSPLSFNNNLGEKISFYGTTNNNYGLGIQSGLLQVHTDGPFSDIVFGQGSSNSFTERMRIVNNNIPGYDGMILNGRLILKNGSTDLVGGGGGAWMYKADNSGLLGFMGAQNNQNIGFYGGPAGWGFTYDAINSRVGIGNNNPNAPLSFPPALGKKITFYPGATGDVGIAVQGNLLQIYADNPSADVAFGYDQGGTFTERFRVKANGALSINGSTGTSGQLLQSNGAASAPVWINPVDPNTLKTQYYQTYINSFTLTNTSGNLDITVPVTVYANSVITVSVTVNVSTTNFGGCINGELSIAYEPLGGGGLIGSMGKFLTVCGSTKNTFTTGELPLLATNGTMKIFGPGTGIGAIVHFTKTNTGPDLTIGNTAPALIIVKVIPQ